MELLTQNVLPINDSSTNFSSSDTVDLFKVPEVRSSVLSNKWIPFTDHTNKETDTNTFNFRFNAVQTPHYIDLKQIIVYADIQMLRCLKSDHTNDKMEPVPETDCIAPMNGICDQLFSRMTIDVNSTNIYVSPKNRAHLVGLTKLLNTTEIEYKIQGPFDGNKLENNAKSLDPTLNTDFAARIKEYTYRSEANSETASSVVTPLAKPEPITVRLSSVSGLTHALQNANALIPYGSDISITLDKQIDELLLNRGETRRLVDVKAVVGVTGAAAVEAKDGEPYKPAVLAVQAKAATRKSAINTERDIIYRYIIRIKKLQLYCQKRIYNDSIFKTHDALFAQGKMTRMYYFNESTTELTIENETLDKTLTLTTDKSLGPIVKAFGVFLNAKRLKGAIDVNSIVYTKPLNLEYVNWTLDGVSVDGLPNHDSNDSYRNDYTLFYRMLAACNGVNSISPPFITFEQFCDSRYILAVDLTTCGGETNATNGRIGMPLLREGTLGLDVNFSPASVEPLTLLIFTFHIGLIQLAPGQVCAMNVPPRQIDPRFV